MKKLHYHFIGIKGVGMTALALCAQDKGIKVTGWDVNEIFVTNKILSERKISWSADPTIPGNPDLVVTTGAHGGLGNPQVLNAQKLGLKVITHAQALGEMMLGKIGISVCGVGGKTTTTAMLATIFIEAGFHPSFACGVGNIPVIGTPGRFDKRGKHFIAEADEYAISPGFDSRPRFTYQKPQAIIVTNIEHDHPDIYQDLNSIKKVYGNFFMSLSKAGLLVGQIDNSNTSELLSKVSASIATTSVGFSPRAQWRISDVHIGEQVQFIKVCHGVFEESLILHVPGNHNALDAVCAAVCANHFGVKWEKIQKSLSAFSGTIRRFEYKGEAGGVRLIDDYAHHPAEIKSLITAARDWFPGKRIILAFQPHTYSRTKSLFADFVRSLATADYTLLCDIYASKRESLDPAISSQQLAEAVSKYNRNVKYVGPKEELASAIQSLARNGDIVITAGAGDIYHEHESILNALK